MPVQKTNERGAAEMVGVLMLIAIFALAVGIVGLMLLSQPPPEKAPAANLRIINDSEHIYLYHDGGDQLPMQDLKIYVDGQLTDFTGAGGDNTWSTGEDLQKTTNTMPKKVDIVYVGGKYRGTTGFLIAQLLLGDLSSVQTDMSLHTITASTGAGGSITPSGAVKVADGYSQTFTLAAHDSSFEILDVLVDGTSVGVVTSYTFPSVTTDHTISATFKAVSASSYWINVTNSSGGTISPLNRTINSIDEQTYTFKPFTGYLISSVRVNGTEQSPVPSNYTFKNVTTNMTLAVDFSSAYLPGIIGTYYADRQWSLLPVTVIHPRVRYATASAVRDYPGSGSATDLNDWPADYIGKTSNFSANYTGLLRIEVGGTYYFMIRGCSGYRLIIDGTTRLDNLGTPSSNTAYTGTPANSSWTSGISLSPGYYNFTAIMWSVSGTTPPAEMGIFYRNTTSTSVYTQIQAFNHTPLTTPIAGFSATPLSGMAPMNVTFTDMSVDATSVTWDFGDGSNVSHAQNPVHTYTSAGQYTVTQTVSNTYGYDTKTRSNYITVGTTSSCIPGLTAYYYANTSWESPSNTRTDKRIYFADGWYPYDLINTDEVNWPTTSGILPSKNFFSVMWDGYLRVNASDTYSFNVTSDDGARLWIDSDYLTATPTIDNGGLHPSLVKTGTIDLTPGWHHVTVRFYENDERAIAYLLYHPSSSSTWEIFGDYCHIVYSPPPVASFSASPMTGNAPLSIAFTDTSTNSPLTWSWDFGDSNTTDATSQNPVHLYTTNGTYPVSLSVTNGGGSNTSAKTNITVIPELPIVTGISPVAGVTAGGTNVTITGKYFTGATAVKFGTSNASSFTVVSDTLINAYSPAHAMGMIDITVTRPSGTSLTSSADQYTYGAPCVTGIWPGAGSAYGGTSVTILGTDITNATVVRFGTRSTSTITVVNSTAIRVTSPTNYGTTQTVDVTVTTPIGTSTTTPADHFTYGLPTITSVSPATGPTTGGTSVAITGTGFTGVTAVTFGGTAASSYIVNSDTSITAISPARSAGTVDIRVTTGAGQSANTANDNFVYVVLPTVTSISPATGPLSGGTTVTITGTNFASITGVQFGGTAAASYTVNSATSITAVSPAQAAGTVDVTVSVAAGTSKTSSADQFTYAPFPTVTSISPSSGLAGSATTVIITGTQFTGATAVRFGTTNAASYIVNSDTQITAVSPSSVSARTVDIMVTNPTGTSATSSADLYSFYTIQTFLSSTTWTVPSEVETIEYLVVAGGGGGGHDGGGGGGGGVLTGTLTGLSGSQTVTIGNGGAGSATGRGTTGTISRFASVTANGGGGGGSSSNTDGRNGGSGGGATGGGNPGSGSSQGNDGGYGTSWWSWATWSYQYMGGGGGGASGTGGDSSTSGTPYAGGAGGTGIYSVISGTSTAYAGGGGGGGSNDGSSTAGAGGIGGGGAGGVGSTGGTAGTPNTGGGGGSGGSSGSGGAGGSGIVIIKYY